MSVSAQTALHFLLNFINDLLDTKSIEDAHAEHPRALTRDELVEAEALLKSTLDIVGQARLDAPYWASQSCYVCHRDVEYFASDREVHCYPGLPVSCCQCWIARNPGQKSRWEGRMRYPNYEPLGINFWRDDEGSDLPPPSAPPQSEEST